MSDLYINKCKAFISFMLSQQQWSGITQANIDSWISNFKGLSHKEQKLVYKLLTNIIYFSENDIVDALKMGVYKCLSYGSILARQKESNFSTSPHTLQNIHNSNVAKACFVPLLDSGRPHESANNMCRILVQQGIIPSEKSMFLDQVPALLRSGQVNNLVIVDDCVGSGDQLRTFWKETRVIDEGVSVSIRELCEKYHANVNYLTLFGYNRSIASLRSEFPDLNIYCVRELNDQHRVFSASSYVWESAEERIEAFTLFNSLAQNAGIPIYGLYMGQKVQRDF